MLAQLAEVDAIKRYVVVSGGLAWHLMSPPHEEAKTVHDHKDVDLFVIPNQFGTVVQILKDRGFTRFWTKYDGKTKNFYRYGATIKHGGSRVKVLIDLFLEEVPYITIDDIRVVEPKHLLSLYTMTHTSAECIAVQAASKLISRGINPVGRSELVGPNLTFVNK